MDPVHLGLVTPAYSVESIESIESRKSERVKSRKACHFVSLSYRYQQQEFWASEQLRPRASSYCHPNCTIAIIDALLSVRNND